LPKFSAAGETAVGATPVPLSATVEVGFDAVVVMVSELAN
jgi:hypothetical protein